MTTDHHHTPRGQLLQLLAEHSFRLGEFKLSSGGRSDYYIDCRTTTLHAEGARLTGRVVLDLIREKGWRPEALGGMSMGADPIVTAVSLLTAQEAQARSSSRSGAADANSSLIHGFLVRKKEKEHGTGQRIEGFRARGARVVIVDDVCTTGSSTIQAIEAARESGFQIAGVVCLVEREEAGGRPQVERAAADAEFASIFMAAEVREEHLRLKHLASTV